MADRLPVLNRQQLGEVFKDPRTLIAFESYQRQIATVIPTDITGLQNLHFVLTQADTTNAPNGHLLAAGANINVAAASGSVTIKATPSGSSGQIQYNNAGAFAGGNLSGDVTTSGSLATTIANGAVTTPKIADSAVTYAKMQNTSAAAVLLGRGAGSGAGSIQEIGLGTGLSMSGTTLNAAISSLLDTISTTPGAILYRGASGWSALAPGALGDVLQTNGTGADPSWVPQSGGGAGSAPTYRGGTLSGAITGTSATLTLPTGSVAGDFLVFMGAGGNGGYPTSSSNGSNNGWTRVTAENSFWNVEVFTRTLTSADITAGNIPVTVTGSFINYAGIFTFATGAYLASFGINPLTFQSTTGQAPGNPTLTPTCGKVDVNANIFWLIMVSCRGVNAVQGLDGGTQIGASGTNANGSASFFYTTFSGLPIINSIHNGTPSSLGDVMLGILGP